MVGGNQSVLNQTVVNDTPTSQIVKGTVHSPSRSMCGGGDTFTLTSTRGLEKNATLLDMSRISNQNAPGSILDQLEQFYENDEEYKNKGIMSSQMLKWSKDS